MSDKINTLNLCVCMALADHGLGKDETAEILRIAKEIKVDFNVHNASDVINEKLHKPIVNRTCNLYSISGLGS